MDAADKEFAKKYEAIAKENYEHRGEKWPKGLSYTPVFRERTSKACTEALRIVQDMPRKEKEVAACGES